MPFQQGESGNPAGRPRGARNRRTLLAEHLIDGDAEAITKRAIALAKDGDMAAIRLCMDRIWPRPKDRPVPFELPALANAADAVAAMGAIVRAVADGDVSPAEAAELTKVVDGYVRTLEAAGLEARVTRLEGIIEK
jgi:uncharacterized protein DUF5681